MKQNICARILPVVLFTMLLSCKKSFLEVADNSNPNRQTYVKDMNSMQDFVKGIYVALSSEYEDGINAAYPGLVADELKILAANRPLALHYNWSQVADDNQSPDFRTSMNATWKDFYLIIRSCNFVIEEINKYADENPERAKILEGEAYAIRALVHFKLVNIFAQGYPYTSDASHPGIPYITTSDVTKPFFRQTVAEVYANLISDLKEAIAVLPATVSDCRYMNSVAAKALLARVYLFKNDYVNAKIQAQELINQYPLLTIGQGYPVDMFKNKKITQTEVFFQITPIENDLIYTNFLGSYFDIDYYVATADIASILKENVNDIRNTWVFNPSDRWRVKKFTANAAGGQHSDPASDYYAPVVRSSEMYLTAAEAGAKTNDEAGARRYLNDVRKRADPSIADVMATGQALLDSIYKERRKELCFEGLRMFDLQRWKMPVQRIDVFTGYQATLSYPNNKALAPIPRQDVTLMGLAQNPDY